MQRSAHDPHPAAAKEKAQVQFSPIRKGEPATIGEGCTILQFRQGGFPTGTMSPFVLVDHFEMWKPTFDVHSHAGMSAVTLVFEDTKGLMASRDSLGHNTSFGAGDLHWTVAGRGILHTQLPADTGSHIHALQIFVNLPARLKSMQPDTFRVAAADMPEIRLHGARVRVVAGEFYGQKSREEPPQPVLMLDGYLEAGHEKLSLPLPADWNAWIYVVDGNLKVDGSIGLVTGQALCASVFTPAPSLTLQTGSFAHFVVLAGPRIDEPVIQHGAFVFESQSSLEQAIADLKAGRFGQVAPHP